uniref:Keratinocyte differentiation factor 1a n=1 Tax=Maylandia zebra TaxID=106582 RepID=A0A3P9CQ96_9CICH
MCFKYSHEPPSHHPTSPVILVSPLLHHYTIIKTICAKCTPSHPRNGTGRGSETIGFIPGSADSVPSSRQSCASMGWSSCKALICSVLTCGFYGTREPCLPVNESSTDHTPKTVGDPRPPNSIAVKTPGILPLNDSFRYPDVHIAGQKVKYPVADPKRGRASGKGDNQRPVSSTSLISYEDYDLDEQSDKDIDSLITKKLLELYALHQIDQLAKCTSDSSFSRKTNEISELIYSIAQDYNLEEQEAECKLVHGVIRISTRKGKRNKGYLSTGQHHNSRRDGTFMSSDFPEVKVSEQTPLDELARKMRNYSGRTYSSSTTTAYSAYHHDTETYSSGAPLIL